MGKMTIGEPLTGEIISDEEIITRILQGEKDLYALIVRRYNQRLYRIGISIINDEREVEDIMQVTYINAYENLGKFAFKASFSTWLTRILINESLLRLRKREQSIIMNEGSMENTIQLQSTQEPRTPATTVINAELRDILDHAIRDLPEIYRSVFVMREIENMNIAETKACLFISEENVKVRLNRAKAMLRASLKTYYKKEDILHFHLSRCTRMVETVMKNLGSL